MAREYFNAYHSYLKAIEPFNDSERGRLFTALLEYSITGEVPELSGNERFIFPTMQQQIDRDASAYEDKCAKNRRNGAQANAGERPPSLPNGTECPQTPPKEKEKEKEKEKYNAATAATGVREDLALCCQHYEQNIGTLSQFISESILDRLDHGAQPDLVRVAIDQACANNARTWKYIDAILSRCESQKICTAAAYAVEQQARTTGAKKSKCDSKKEETNNPFLRMVINGDLGRNSQAAGDDTPCVPQLSR